MNTTVTDTWKKFWDRVMIAQFGKSQNPYQPSESIKRIMVEFDISEKSREKILEENMIEAMKNTI